MIFTRNSYISHTDYSGEEYDLTPNTPRFHNNRIVENVYGTLTPTFFTHNNTPIGVIEDATYLDKVCKKININNVNVGVQQPLLVDTTKYSFKNTHTSFRFSVVLSRDLEVGEALTMYFNDTKQGSHMVTLNDTKSPSTSFTDFGGTFYVNNIDGQYGFYILGTLNNHIDIYIKDIFLSDNMNYVGEYVDTIKTFPYLTGITTESDRIYSNYGERFSSNGILIDHTIETMLQTIVLTEPFAIYCNYTLYDDTIVNSVIFEILGIDQQVLFALKSGDSDSMVQNVNSISLTIDKAKLLVVEPNKLLIAFNSTNISVSINGVTVEYPHTFTTNNLVGNCTYKLGGDINSLSNTAYYGELMVYNSYFDLQKRTNLTINTKFAYEPARIGNMTIGNNFTI